ncbi:MAG: TRAP transporter small permease [Alphaproteobacteria bacterium]|nr:TRAP transporter small permease [Alphaproteobacteria bacterium]
MEALARIADALRRVEEAVAIGLVIAIAVILNLQVVCRYFLDSPLIWPEEIARLSLIWLTYVGCAAVAARGGHIAVDMLVARLPDAARRRAFAAIELVLGVVFAILAWLALRLAQSLAGMETAATEIPMAWLAAPLVVGGVLSAFHCAARAALALGPGRPTEVAAP